MSLTINTKTYSQDRVSPDAVVYAGPAHTFSKTDQVELKRVYPKPTKDFRGVARPTIKTVRTVTLDDGTTADVILQTSGSIPVGITPTDLVAVIADHNDVLGFEEAGTTKVISAGDITY